LFDGPGHLYIAKYRRNEAFVTLKVTSEIAIWRRLLTVAACASLAAAGITAHAAPMGVSNQIDAAVQSRVHNVAGFSDVERYAVYRGSDDVHPVAAMTVKVTYRKGIGENFAILSQSGSAMIRRFGLDILLSEEKKLNMPAYAPGTWFTSVNYKMKLESDAMEQINGRECYAVAITPRHKAPNMIKGTLWVDSRDFSVVKVQGIASRKPYIFAGTTHMMRNYVDIDGYPMATYARAESNSPLFGRTVVTVEYSHYQLQLQPDH
jgi:hypothetical protein